jgi:CheY-like chemotaxis protein
MQDTKLFETILGITTPWHVARVELMADGTGEELTGRLREYQPSLKVVIATGHAAMLDQEGSPWWTQERHLRKPFKLRDLRLAVTELIGDPTPPPCIR